MIEVKTGFLPSMRLLVTNRIKMLQHVFLVEGIETCNTLVVDVLDARGGELW